MKKFVQIIVIAYGIVCMAACTLQRELIYHPVTGIESPETYGLHGVANLRLKDADGTHIAAWYHEARPGYPTIVAFHGNGGTMADRAHYFHALIDAGFGLLAIDYRGYGASEGSPTEQGFYQDARAAAGYATGTLHLPLNKIMFYGESIGTGVAVQMGTEFAAGAVVLQSPYTSIEAIAGERYPFLPVHLLLEDRFDSISKIGRIHAPLLVFHGLRDTIIPPEEGKALFAHANEPKEMVFFPEGHNDLTIPGRIKALLAFGHKYNLIKD
jgi:uncharacterized protein